MKELKQRHERNYRDRRQAVQGSRGRRGLHREDQVLAILDGDKATFGTPVVEGASVEGKIVKNGKGKKIRIFKYNAKKGYRKRQGHRQPYTKVEIGKISV